MTGTKRDFSAVAVALNVVLSKADRILSHSRPFPRVVP
jgi:hypothetical protein